MRQLVIFITCISQRLASECHNVLCLSYPLQPDCILALYKRSGDCLNLYAILGNTDLEWLLIQLFRVYMSSPRCKSWWDNNQLPAFGLFVISSSLFMLSVERTARIFTCRPTIPYRGFLCPECVLLCCRNVADYRVQKKTRGNVTRFSHIVSRKKFFFSWRIGAPGADSVPASDMAPIVAMFVSKWISQTLRDTNLALVNVIF